MDENLKLRDIEGIARRWRELADRRREHFADLHQSGRWRKYYREQTFFTQMQETARMIDAWNRLAPADRPQPAGGSADPSALGWDAFCP